MMLVGCEEEVNHISGVIQRLCTIMIIYYINEEKTFLTIFVINIYYIKYKTTTITGDYS